MTQAIVVDASVALQWVLPAEEHAAAAVALLRDSVRDQNPMLVPPHFFSEVANGVHRRTRTARTDARITQEEADAALSTLLDYALRPLAPVGLYVRALRMARTYDLPSLYDALYLALADIGDCLLWTDDHRLIRALEGRLAFVRWIGEYRP